MAIMGGTEILRAFNSRNGLLRIVCVQLEGVVSSAIRGMLLCGNSLPNNSSSVYISRIGEGRGKTDHP